MSAKVTISRRSNQKTEGCVSISIEDRESGLRIVEVEMELSEFAEAVTGMSYCEAEYRFIPTQYTIDNINKKREIKYISVDRPLNIYDKELEKLEILKLVDNSGELVDGWELKDDGTTSQQVGGKHQVILIRFVELTEYEGDRE